MTTRDACPEIQFLLARRMICDQGQDKSGCNR
jgi:hypothetical protein